MHFERWNASLNTAIASPVLFLRQTVEFGQHHYSQGCCSVKESYDFLGGALRASQSPQATVHVYIAPTEAERGELIQELGVDAYDLNAALDLDEIPRLEAIGDTITLIWKRPRNVSVAEQLRFDVASAALFLRGDTAVLVTCDEHLPFDEREFRGMANVRDLLLRLQLHTVHHYLGHLKVIKQLTAELGSKLNGSMENRYYLQMLALSESLIYYVDGIEANMSVLGKLHSAAQRLCLSPEQIESLHNITLDTQQCARQANIYSNVLSGLMDARGAIINNNVNTLLKNLTLISVIFLPLNLLASIGGMSEFSSWTNSIDWHVAYSVMLLGMALLAWLMWIFVVRVLDPCSERRTIPGLASLGRGWQHIKFWSQHSS